MWRPFVKRRFSRGVLDFKLIQNTHEPGVGEVQRDVLDIGVLVSSVLLRYLYVTLSLVVATSSQT